MIFWTVGIAVVVIAGATYASRRGWINLGFRRPPSSGSGAFGELIDAFHPSHSYFAEEMDRDRSVFEESAPRHYNIQSDELTGTDAGDAEEPGSVAWDTHRGEENK